MILSISEELNRKIWSCTYHKAYVLREELTAEELQEVIAINACYKECMGKTFVDILTEKDVADWYNEEGDEIDPDEQPKGKK